MSRKLRKENKGITLIALIITIIVMLILVSVTIGLTVNSDIFGKAQEAGREWQQNEVNLAQNGASFIDETVRNITAVQQKPSDELWLENAEELLDNVFSGNWNVKKIKLLDNIEIPANTLLKINAGQSVNINLNGYKIIGSGNASGNDTLFEVQGLLNIENGGIEYAYTGENKGYNSASMIFNVTSGGTLNLSDTVLEHQGGTDMNIVVHLNNWGEVTLDANNCEFNADYCSVRVFNSGPEMNNVTIKNSKLTGGPQAFLVHNYVGDISNKTEEEINARLNIDIYNNNNTFEVTSTTAPSPIKYGFSSPIYYDESGNVVE